MPKCPSVCLVGLMDWMPKCPSVWAYGLLGSLPKMSQTTTEFIGIPYTASRVSTWNYLIKPYFGIWFRRKEHCVFAIYVSTIPQSSSIKFTWTPPQTRSPDEVKQKNTEIHKLTTALNGWMDGYARIDKWWWSLDDIFKIRTAQSQPHLCIAVFGLVFWGVSLRYRLWIDLLFEISSTAICMYTWTLSP